MVSASPSPKGLATSKFRVRLHCSHQGRAEYFLSRSRNSTSTPTLPTNKRAQLSQCAKNPASSAHNGGFFENKEMTQHFARCLLALQTTRRYARANTSPTVQTRHTRLSSWYPLQHKLQRRPRRGQRSKYAVNLTATQPTRSSTARLAPEVNLEMKPGSNFYIYEYLRAVSKLRSRSTATQDGKI